MKRIATIIVLCALVACTQQQPKAVPGVQEPRAVQQAETDAEPARTLDPPRVQMQVGTKYVRGALVRACAQDRCEDGSGRKVRPLGLDDERLVMFVFERKPKAAAVEVRRAGSEKVVSRRTLRPSTTTPYSPRLKNARYDVLLDGEWNGMRARWRFVLNVS